MSGVGFRHVVYSKTNISKENLDLTDKEKSKTIYSRNYISNAFLCNTRLLAVHNAVGALDK